MTIIRLPVSIFVSLSVTMCRKEGGTQVLAGRAPAPQAARRAGAAVWWQAVFGLALAEDLDEHRRRLAAAGARWRRPRHHQLSAGAAEESMAARHECNLSRLVQAHHALGRLSGRLLRLRRRRLPSLLPPSRLRCLGCLRQARVVRGAACAASTATARGSPGGPGVAGQVRRRGGAAVTFASPSFPARATRASATIAAEVQRPRVRQRCLRRRARAQRACADLQAARNAYKLTA